MKRSEKPEIIAFCKRTRFIRDQLKWGRQKMANKIGTTVSQIQKYEKRTPMPIEIIPVFCLATGYDSWFVLTGRPNFEQEATNTELDMSGLHTDKNKGEAVFQAQTRRSRRKYPAKSKSKH